MSSELASPSLDVTSQVNTKPTRITPNNGGRGGELIPVRDTQSAAALANRRWAKYRALAASGAAQGTDSGNSFEAWLKMTREQASKALRGDTRAYLAVGRAMGALDTMRDTLTQATHSALDDFALLVNDIIAHNPTLAARLTELRTAPRDTLTAHDIPDTD